jgi:hypothetical protein
VLRVPAPVLTAPLPLGLRLAGEAPLTAWSASGLSTVTCRSQRDASRQRGRQLHRARHTDQYGSLFSFTAGQNCSDLCGAGGDMRHNVTSWVFGAQGGLTTARLPHESPRYAHRLCLQSVDFRRGGVCGLSMSDLSLWRAAVLLQSACIRFVALWRARQPHGRAAGPSVPWRP